MVTDQNDPMSNVTYRAAVQAANRLNVRLTAWREGRMWAVRADYADGIRAAITTTGRTAADAAWHALAAVKAAADAAHD